MACTQNDTTNNIPRIVRGNDFTLKVDVKKPVLKDGETTLEDFPIEDSTDISVNLVTQLGARIKMPYTVSGSTVLVNFEETVSSGLYGLEVTGKQNGKDWRFYAMPGELLEIVEPTSSAYIPSTDTVDGYYSVTAQAGVVSISEDIIQQQANSVIEEKIGEYTDTLALKSEVEVKADKTDLDNKVDKEEGKGLSANDYTNEEKTKLAGIEAGANKITVDSALKNSANPVQNRVVQEALAKQEAKTLLISHDTDNATAVSLQGGYVNDENQERNPSATGQYSTAIGIGNTASGTGSFASGEVGTASGKVSHTEGYVTTASGNGAHSEGQRTIANGNYSHSEGYSDVTPANESSVNQPYTQATGLGSHAEGYRTLASGAGAHAEGGLTIAAGNRSHAEGWYTETTNNYEHASGYFNKSTKQDDDNGIGRDQATLFSIGNGYESNRKNAFEVKKNGDIYFGTTNISTLISDMQSTITSLQKSLYGITLGSTETELKAQYDEISSYLDDNSSSITYSNLHTDTTVTGIYGMSADNIKIAIWQEDELDQGGSVTAHTIKYGLATDSTTSSFTLYSVNTKGTVTVDDTVLKASPIMYGAKLYGLKDK